MKRIFLVLMCIVLVVIAMTSCSNGYNTSDEKKGYDSLNLSKEELKKVRDEKDDIVIKLPVDADTLYRMGKDDSIQDIWKEPVFPSGNSYFEYFVISKDGSISSKTMYGGSMYEDGVECKEFEEFFCNYVLNTQTVFDRECKIENVYCKVESTLTDKIALIYYVTNDGDYILYKAGINKDEYLFSEDVFEEFVKKLATEDGVEERYSEQISSGVVLGAQGHSFRLTETSIEVFDMSPYKFNGE